MYIKKCQTNDCIFPIKWQDEWKVEDAIHLDLNQGSDATFLRMILAKLIEIDLNVKSVTWVETCLTDCQLMIRIGVLWKNRWWASFSWIFNVPEGGDKQRVWVFMFFTWDPCIAHIKMAEHSFEVEQANPRPVIFKVNSLVKNLG